MGYFRNNIRAQTSKAQHRYVCTYVDLIRQSEHVGTPVEIGTPPAGAVFGRHQVRPFHGGPVGCAEMRSTRYQYTWTTATERPATLLLSSCSASGHAIKWPHTIMVVPLGGHGTAVNKSQQRRPGRLQQRSQPFRSVIHRIGRTGRWIVVNDLHRSIARGHRTSVCRWGGRWWPATRPLCATSHPWEVGARATQPVSNTQRP